MIEITPSEIKRMANPISYSRGQSYHRSGRVLTLEIKGRSAEAAVDGSRSTPYTVTVMQNGSKIKTSCTCPYNWGGMCKHEVAVLLELANGQKTPMLSKDRILQMSPEESAHLLESICNPIPKSGMKELLKLWEIKDKDIPEQKKEMVNSIIKASHDTAKVEWVLTGLPQDEYDFLELLSSMNFVIPHFEAELAVGYWEIEAVYRSLRSKCLLTMIRAPGTHYVVPPHMHDAMRFAIEKKEYEPLDVTNIKEVRVNGGILNDLMIFLFYAEKNRVQLTRQNSIYKRTIEKMASLLSIKEEGYLGFVCTILVKLGLIRISNFHLVVNRKKTQTLFKKDRAEITKAVITAAFDMSTNYYGWNAFKSVFTDIVTSMEKTQWSQVNGVHTKLKKSILENPKSSLKYWSLDERRRRLGKVLMSLNLAGAVELGLLDDDNIYALRLTEAGTAFFTGRKNGRHLKEKESGGKKRGNGRGMKKGKGKGKGKAGSAKPVPCIYVQPNFEVTVLLDGAPMSVLFTLNGFGELKSINEHTATFMISKDSVVNALEDGIKAADVIKSLKRNSKTGVPQNVLYDIKEWASGFDRVFIQDMTVLKADKKALLDDIIKIFDSGVIERIGPTSVAVEPSAVKEITGKLKKMNIHPRIKNTEKRRL